MGRTRSMPGVDGTGRLLYPPQFRPASPSGSPSRQRTPRKPVDEAYPPSPVRTSVLDGDRQHAERSNSPTPSFTSPVTLPSYKRASSPLRYSAYSSPTPSFTFPGPPSSGIASSSFRPESSTTGYSLSYYPSSVPSTPSSMRSRSPSISSLETIPDTPDAEEEALEAERIAQLKAAADAAENGDSKSRSSLDAAVRGRTLGVGSKDKRKRWSVCGAERRGDLDLETIWED
ncbi:hypothetical protein GQX73_g4734 [Xylaria multiplex]|uniref:Basic proline-rich protein n=1 Tax=Xylaria multiplex TaxID=323545 RepID=A0A7C8MQC2_9PEZI|nr:hypothetical protein GQX73_g4734 [Xylaria multiplex]